MSTQNDVPAPERFTLSADPSAEALLTETVKELREDIAHLPSASSIRAVLLGGGYGRAEGGVFRTPDGASHLYNDMDFFVISKNISAACRKEIDAELNTLRGKWAGKLGIDVDFSRSRTQASLRDVSHTLMFQELQAGHRLVFGTHDSFALLPKPDFSAIPFSEGARLLMNRGAGLLLAWPLLRAKKELDGEQNDFVIRNIYKAVFGCGDAMLIRRKLYCAGIEARLARLESLPDLPEDLPALYREALAFKSRPYRDGREILLEKWTVARSLWLRTVASFFLGNASEKTDAAAIPSAILSSSLAQEGTPLKNILLNGLAFRLGLRGIRWFSHPRKVLLSNLYIFLLAIPGIQGYISDSTAAIDTSTWLRIWNRFN